MTEDGKSCEGRARKTTKLIGKKTWKGQKVDKAQGTVEGRGRKSKNIGLAVPTRRDAKDFSMFESSTSYILDDMNSIAFVNDRFYNLLKIRPRSLWGRLVKCKCSKSKCQARYCECFSHGQICGVECSCQGCHNTNQATHEQSKAALREDNGCHCSRSECLKNYCECFQKGQNCTQKCRCSNCRNCS